MTEKTKPFLIARSASYHKWSIRDILTSFFYYKNVITIAFIIPCVLGFMASLMARPSFTAHARLLVLYGNEYVFHPTDQQSGSSIVLDRDQIMQGELGILNSPTLAQEVVNDVGRQALYPGMNSYNAETRQNAVTRFSRDLRITIVPQSNIIEISLRNLNRNVARRALEVFVQDYIRYRTEVFNRRTTDVPSTLHQQMVSAFHDAENHLVNFELEHNISDLPQQYSLLLRRVSDLEDEKTGIISEVNNLDAQIKTIEHALDVLPKVVELYAETDQSDRAKLLTNRLAELMIQKADVGGRYKDDFPILQDINKQISDIEKNLHQTPPREKQVTRQGANSVYNELYQQNILLHSRSEGLRAKETTIADSAEKLHARLHELTSLSAQYRALQTERDILGASYQAITQNAEEARLTTVANQQASANIRVVQPPETPLHGTSLRLPLLVLGIFSGGIVGGAVLALCVTTQKIFITVRDVESMLGLPVLAAVTDRNPPAPKKNSFPFWKRKP